MELIRLEEITKTYYLGEIDVPVLRGVSLSIRQGEMVALMGASGSGKTTLMNLLGCLDRPTSGRYWLEGQEISLLSADERALLRVSKIGFVFQNFNLLSRTSALENVILPVDYAPRRPAPLAAWQTARRLLDEVGLGDRANHEPSQLSGGQQQRIAIARALVNDPVLLLADEPTGNLDSHTSAEILRMFQQLNEQGLTVILVTHDPHVAEYAHRIIEMKDGIIENDRNLSAPSASRLSAAKKALAACGSGEGGCDVLKSPRDAIATEILDPVNATIPDNGGQVVLSGPQERPTLAADGQHKYRGSFTSPLPPALRTALAGVRRNRLRSALTALGVIIGVGAVIAMTEIGEGSRAAIQRTIANMGANNLSLQSGTAASGGVTFGHGSMMTLTPNDAFEIERQCPSVSVAAPTVHARAQIVYQNKNWSPSASDGTTPDFLQVRDWQDLAEGDMFTDHDVQSVNTVCVIGSTVKRELFGEEPAVGKEIRMRNVPFRVVGVLGRKGANMMGADQDDIVLAPWTTVKYRVSGVATAVPTETSSTTSQLNTLNNLYPAATTLYPQNSAAQLANYPQLRRFSNVDHILVKATSTEEIPQAIAQVSSVLRQQHHLRADEADDFNVRNITEMTDTLASTSRLMGLLLLAVALISLVVGGVGIMNIMLVSVTERTREIGLRMAVGARAGQILRQFLAEAVLLCLFGGTVGILLGRVVSICVRSIMTWPTQPSLMAILLAAAISVAVGIVFGFYPAWKASKLDPIEALRYE